LDVTSKTKGDFFLVARGQFLVDDFAEFLFIIKGGHLLLPLLLMGVVSSFFLLPQKEDGFGQRLLLLLVRLM
jgi:hypothetical protein